MKRLMAVILLALPLCTIAADEIKVTPYYKAGEFNIGAYGTVTTPDFTSERTGVGLSAALFVTRNWGAEIEAFGGSIGGKLIDQAAAQLIYRIPVNKSAPYLFAGAYHHVDRNEFGVSVGLGIEHRFTSHLGIFTDARLEKLWASGDPAARARVGVKIPF